MDLLLFLQEYVVVNVARQLLLIVSDHDHSLVPPLAERLDDILHEASVEQVESMKRFVEDEQRGVFDKGASQQDQSLFSAAELEEGSVGIASHTEDVEPELAYGSLFGFGLSV